MAARAINRTRITTSRRGIRARCHRDHHRDDHRDMGRPPMHADAGPGHPDWHKGDRLSGDYHNRQYVVDDWRGYGLHQPPHGYHWVGVGADYLLVAVSSGLIAQVVLAQ